MSYNKKKFLCTTFCLKKFSNRRWLFENFYKKIFQKIFFIKNFFWKKKFYKKKNFKKKIFIKKKFYKKYFFLLFWPQIQWKKIIFYKKFFFKKKFSRKKKIYVVETQFLNAMQSIRWTLRDSSQVFGIKTWDDTIVKNFF